jgi:hypothetical protein
MPAVTEAPAAPASPGDPVPAPPAPAEVPLEPEASPTTLKEAYEEFAAALAAAGFDPQDRDLARRLMQGMSGRASTKENPYTREEFLKAARSLRARQLAA